jgi:hypothetical protein
MNSPPLPIVIGTSLCFAKRGCKTLYISKFPLFAKQRGGKEGGEFVSKYPKTGNSIRLRIRYSHPAH